MTAFGCITWSGAWGSDCGPETDYDWKCVLRRVTAVHALPSTLKGRKTRERGGKQRTLDYFPVANNGTSAAAPLSLWLAYSVRSESFPASLAELCSIRMHVNVSVTPVLRDRSRRSDLECLRASLPLWNI